MSQGPSRQGSVKWSGSNRQIWQDSISSVRHSGDEDRLIAEDGTFELQHYGGGSMAGLSRSNSRRQSMSTLQPNGPTGGGLSPSGSIRRGPTPIASPRGNSFRSQRAAQPRASSNSQDLHQMSYSRCGSKQSLLDSASQRSQRISHEGLETSQTGAPKLSGQQAETTQRDTHLHPHVVRPHPPHSHVVDMDRRQRNARRKDIQKKLDKWDTHPHGRCHWSFVFDPAGRLCYYWSMVVSLACLYNYWVIIFRFSFAEITLDTIVIWFSLDYLMDLIYFLDIVFHFRTGYLEDGVLQTDTVKLRQHYMNSTTFYVDCLCLLPLDFLYLSLGFKSVLRIFRLVKVYQFWAFTDRSERHTNYPNLLRFVSMVHYLLLAFHWNACMFHLVHKSGGFGSSYETGPLVGSAWSELRYPVENDSVMTYLMSYYWTILAMTTIGDLPQPKTKGEYLFVIFELLIGLITFATVLGYVANIVTNVSAARKDFQAKLDGVKTYMRLRRVPNSLQNKVIKWFDYLWLTQKSSDEEKSISCLPDKLKGEIAIHVHLDTLKRVEIFQNTEAGFLCELVLRLRPVLFSPGDYICRKGEVGKEMYICARGRLEVVADEGKTILATLKAGSYFGEISILNMGTAGNRRTASVRSVGYSDLFVLSKKDMWDVLKDYPAARVRLEAIAVKRLEKYKKAPLEKAALPRSESTPGLVESSGMIPLEEMWVSPLPLYSPKKEPHPYENGTNNVNLTRNTRSQPNDPHNSSPTSELSSTKSHSTATSIRVTNEHHHHPHHHHSQSKSTIGTTRRTSLPQQPGPPLLITEATPSPPAPVHPDCSQHAPPVQWDNTTMHPKSPCAPHNGSLVTNVSSIPPVSVSNSVQGFASQECLYHHLPPYHHHHYSAPLPHQHFPSSQASGLIYSDLPFSIPSSTITCSAPLPYPSQPLQAQGDQKQGSSPKEELLLEIRRLRERIKTLEGANATMHLKLTKNQKDVDQRLAEIEMQIDRPDEFNDDEVDDLAALTSGSCSIEGSENGVDDDNDDERNRESFI